MATTRRKVTLASLGLTGAAGVLALALTGPGMAFADPSPAPSTSSSAQADRDARRTAKQDAEAEALAKELGIDKAKVLAALEKVRTAQQTEAKADRTTRLKEQLAQSVTDGKLTQAEADAILKANEAGVLTGGGGGGGPR